MSDRRLPRVLLALSLLGALAACGQKGPLYLPDQAREVVTRPAPDAQTPEDESKDDDQTDENEKQPEPTAPR